MKALKPLLFFCVALCLATSCKKEVDMTLVQKTLLENADIWRINVDDGWEVTIVYDSVKSFVEIEYSAYLEDKISVAETDEWVAIGFNTKVYPQLGSVFKATVHTSEKQFLNIRADNASIISMEGLFELENGVDMELHNASVCNGFEVTAPSCSIHLDYDSQIHGVSFDGTQCSVYAYKGSSCKGSFNVGQTFTTGVYEASRLIVFGGSMPTASIEVKDAGFISMAQAEAREMSVYLDGASEATVNVAETMGGFLLSASTLYYKGNPQIDIDCSDDSQLIPF